MPPQLDGQQTLVIAGLGNPGLRYETTRHNLGFMVVKALAQKWAWQLKEEKRFNSLVVKGSVKGVQVHLIMPLTYMNLSGEAIRSYLHYYKLSSDPLLVVLDDISLPYGQMKLKSSGRPGGHNGLKNIELNLGTSQYNRLKMGIGHPGSREMTDYVLEPFSQEEKKELNSFVDRGVEVLERLINEDISRVMNAVNRVPEKESIDLTKPPLKGEENKNESEQTKPL